MSRLMYWLKQALSPRHRSIQKSDESLAKESALATEVERRQAVADDMSRRDWNVDRRITALEQFAEQLKRRQQRHKL